jgi:predicted DNA-binding transcriptional regulator YafY
MADRLERLVNLTATLLDTRRALTLEELAERVEPRYPDDKGARRRQFERDKETLRELGVPISVESVDGIGADQAYRINPKDYYLQELSLTDAELAALHLAVSAVRLEGGYGREGLAKLGGLAGEGVDVAMAEVAVTPVVAALFDAVSRRAAVTFEYRGEKRSLEPYGVVLRWGHWYVVGHDRERDAPRLGGARSARGGTRLPATEPGHLGDCHDGRTGRRAHALIAAVSRTARTSRQARMSVS